MKHALNIFLNIFILSFLFSCNKNNELENEKNKTVLDTFSSNVKLQNVPNSEEESVVDILQGSFLPLYGNGKKKVSIENFQMAVYPITNAKYIEFVKNNPTWRKSNVLKIFADENYLNTWKDDTTLGNNISPNAAVTNISWYAANAYCEANGMRLPTVDEWEYVAMADETKIDARTKKSYNQYILDWYEKSNTYKNDIGNTYKNIWGVYDMHGLVWEWTSDFNSILISGENRGSENNDKNLFCGSASLGANDLMNYAAFMRYAFRSSLKGNYCVQNLGFRCVKK